MTLLILLLSFAHAQEKSAFEQSLVKDTGARSEESWVEIKQKRYRKFDMQGGLYYLRFKDGGAQTADIYCVPPAGYKEEVLIIEQPRSEVRSREFVQAFHEVCSRTKATQQPATIKLNPAIGLTYPSPKKEDDRG